MSFFRNNKCENKENNNIELDYKHKYSKLKIHMAYCLSIACIFIVELFTVRGYSNDDLNTMIGFAATISGIILSVLAIIMTIVGETKSENTKDKLLDISGQLNKTVKNIEDVVSGLDKSGKDLQKVIDGNNKLTNMMDEINTSIGKMKYENSNNEESNFSEQLLTSVNRAYKENGVRKLIIILYYSSKRFGLYPTEVISYEIIQNNFLKMNLSKKRILDMWQVAILFPSNQISQGQFNEYINKFMQEECVEEKNSIDTFFNTLQN